MNSRMVWRLQRFCEQKTFWFRARSLLARVWNGRGGACVPARTSAQRRFHPKMMYCHPQTLHFHPRMMHFHVQTLCFCPSPDAPNDGCALAGRHGRAHRHRPYPSPSYFSVQSTHNQQPLRPRSCNTIHHLEMNERQYASIRHRFPYSENLNIIVSATEIQCTPCRLISPIGGCSVYLCTS